MFYYKIDQDKDNKDKKNEDSNMNIQLQHMMVANVPGQNTVNALIKHQNTLGDGPICWIRDGWELPDSMPIQPLMIAQGCFNEVGSGDTEYEKEMVQCGKDILSAYLKDMEETTA